MEFALIGLGLFLLLILIFLFASIKQVQQYEKGIVFRFGRILPGVREPGLTVILPFVDTMQKVNMQVTVMGVPSQECITRDNVTVRVDAVVYFIVVDPIKAIVNVQNYMYAVSQVSQTSLRAVIGRSELDQLLSERDMINDELARIIDEPTEGPWGIRVDRVEIKDVALPPDMQRLMSRQAEADRDRRARMISADAEYQASKRLAAAAQVLQRDPASLQLRLLQTLVDVAAEKNNTVIMPLPIELLRFVGDAGRGTAAPSGGDHAEEAAPSEHADPLDAEVREISGTELTSGQRREDLPAATGSGPYDAPAAHGGWSDPSGGNPDAQRTQTVRPGQQGDWEQYPAQPGYPPAAPGWGPQPG
ncbi:slipin family protein [Allonocardiopsis opalescens]|uniref:Regulator of protease activity HflC (Stomatin/prohibitin superfamily) n=1 Tax=Allonocardiopsis opalescens TaxID=1144618 RepID=A0A2T0Q6Y9_9ACTN|nr:slipin family protein [Allonocardiopsis opalescens]PRX99493.1 regulator of protease activity HflC (stomatin/prohibitin superfamily) [Allonocardiopsis opalescens]